MPTICPYESLPLAGYPVISTTAVALTAMLQDRLAKARKTVLVFANSNLVLKCAPIRSWFCGDDVIVVNDGLGMDIAALIMHGRRYRANLNGTDFVPNFLKTCLVRRSVFLYGGEPGVAEKAGVVIEREFGQSVAGCAHGYSKVSAADLCAEINRSNAEIVLVALGNPIQEEWMRANMNALDAKLLIGVGALFDFLSGRVRRAPLWIQRMRCEWLYRLYQEPKRLVRRYTVDVFGFLLLCVRHRRRAGIPQSRYDRVES